MEMVSGFDSSQCAWMVDCALHCRKYIPSILVIMKWKVIWQVEDLPLLYEKEFETRIQAERFVLSCPGNYTHIHFEPIT